ncbi:MAG: NCS2 family permease [Selenomonadales bacterium]|jgi:AGZA family xanthine/uracil permease-like MFS transporter|nr:NCS2 family permease [Selenomonadales bacterium]MBQ5746226.1 NCS2 family permease [Selenomonadales bacterium]
MLEKLFHIKERGSSVRTEMIAGLTTFVTISYVIFVIPNMLCDAGMPKEAAIAATMYATIMATILMGLVANYPVAVAPGLGINAFFAYYVVGFLGLPWQTALGAVFISGMVFLLMTFGGIRQAIIRAVPQNLKTAIGVGIGFFIAFIGMKNAGIVVDDPATFVTLGNIMHGPAMLATLGVILAGALMAKRVQGAMLISIFVLTVAGMFMGIVPQPTSINDIVSFDLPSLGGTFMALDIAGALEFGLFSIIFTFTIVELFDNMGTLIGLTRKAKLMDEKGEVQDLDRALTADAVGAVAGSVMGTTTVTAYIESATGIAEGGKTGLTAFVVAGLFAVALFFAPLVGLVPAYATAPALILVGALMIMEVRGIDFDDLTEGIPAFLTIVMMPLTFSIANGFAFGFISYAFLKLIAGRAKEVHYIVWLVAFAFIANFFMRMQ